MNELSLIKYDPEQVSISDAPFIQREYKNLYEAARDYVFANVPVGNGYTGPEAFAIITFEMLKMVNALDLTNVVLRGKLISQIEKHELWKHLPDKYDSAEQAIEAEAKLSRTQQYAIKNLNDHIFPYIEKHMGMTVPEFYQKIGKSNAQDALPVLRAVITGERSKSERVNAAVDRILETVDPNLPEGERKKQAVSAVIDIASLSNSEARKQLYGSTDPINFTAIKKNGSVFLLAEVDHDQLKMFHNVMGENMDLIYADLDKESVEKLTALREFLVNLLFSGHPLLPEHYKEVSHALSVSLNNYREEMLEVLK